MAAAKVKSNAFDIHAVKTKMPIKKFLESRSVTFAKGKAFYEMTKGEIIQDYKKVVVMRNKDNAFITGEAVRDVLNMPKTSYGKFVLDSDEIPDFSVFIQSTSYNRYAKCRKKIR